MNMLVFDVLFCLALLGLASSAIRVREVFSGVALFIAFGLFMALAWARLSAPDLALTEAALGAGLVGALFLAAQARVEQQRGGPVEKAAPGAGVLVSRALLLLTLVPVVYATSADWLLGRDPAAGGGLADAAYDALPRSGVSHPVTAVLLNYRAYDTLLEVCVLLLAMIAVYALHDGSPPAAVAEAAADDEILIGYRRFAGPIMLVVAGYILWAGSHRAGGAFQAGSILAGAGVLMLLTSERSRVDAGRFYARVALVVGFTAFASVGILLAARGAPFLEWPVPHAKSVIVAIESVATLSIGWTLVLLFAACADLIIPGHTRAAAR